MLTCVFTKHFLCNNKFHLNSKASIIYSDDAEKINSHHDTYVDRWQFNVLIQKEKKEFVIDLGMFWIHSQTSITAVNEGKNFFILKLINIHLM